MRLLACSLCPPALARFPTHYSQLQHHSFSTGGSNWYEHWGAEDGLGEALNNVS
jgi:hypothetical protein